MALVVRLSVACTAVAAVAWTARHWRPLEPWSAPIIASALLALPLALGQASWRHRLPRFHPRRLLPGIADGAVAALLLIPPFFAALSWIGGLEPARVALAYLARALPQQLLLVALPEEFFFRGYVQRMLGALPLPRLRILSARCGPEILIAAAVFALTHMAAGLGWASLLTFFPGLVFGWLYARRQSLVGPAFFHTACNLSMLAWPGVLS